MSRIVAALAMTLWATAAFAEDSRYWKIGADTTHVWSLLGDASVSVSDTAYTAWLAAGHNPTLIGSVTELFDVLSISFPAHVAASALGLETVGSLTPLQSFGWRRTAGLTITYTGASSLNGRYPVDDQWLGGLMTGALLRCGATALSACSTPFPFNLTTYTYLDKDLIAHSMSVTQMRVIVLAIEDHVAALDAQLQVGLSGGTPAWPSLTATVP